MGNAGLTSPSISNLIEPLVFFFFFGGGGWRLPPKRGPTETPQDPHDESWRQFIEDRSCLGKVWRFGGFLGLRLGVEGLKFKRVKV